MEQKTDTADQTGGNGGNIKLLYVYVFFTPQGAAAVATDGTVVTVIPASMYDEAYKALSKALFGY